MKQVLQNLRTGDTTVEDVPTPGLARGSLLIKSRATLISAGTERMLVEFGKAGLVGKAKAQPEKVQQVLDKIRTDGLLPTLDAVFNRLEEPLPLGYCNAGVVVQAGDGVTAFNPGDRVVSNGAHAELVVVPRNLCAQIPDGVSQEQAAFTVVASIGLQGIRLLQPTLGERVVVFGLGLIGLVTVQLLRAHGCEVLGVDLNPRRLELARSFGAETFDASGSGDAVNAVNAWTRGVGADGVVITASAKTDEIVHQAARMCRKRGRIVLVGVVSLNLRRSDFYEKELTFQVSCSYGPGRYDERYEQGGQDYPVGYVRWTEQRNFQAVLDMMATGRLKVEELITHRYPLDQAPAAYVAVASDPNALAVILTYPGEARPERRLQLDAATVSAAGQAVVGVIGAGNFSKMTLMPALAKTAARIQHVCDLNGVAAAHLARKFGAMDAVTDSAMVLGDPTVNAVFVAVGHHLHARFVCEALRAGKHVFVEKPLAMNVDEVRQILEVYRGCGAGFQPAESAAAKMAAPQARNDCGAGVPPAEVSQPPAPPLLMVGFNRRFSPHTVRLKEWLRGRTEPLTMQMTVNAGYIPPDHWVHDPVRGGGRIIGEACHFIDLMVFLTGSLVKTVSAVQVGAGTATPEDKMTIALGFEDGSVGAVNYFANGSKAYPKERIEVFSERRTAQIENFRRTVAYGFKGGRTFKTWRQDKGHAAEFAAFVERVAAGGPPVIPMAELVNVTLASFAAMTAAGEERTIHLSREYAALLAGDVEDRG